MSGLKPFRIMLYLAMYITGHVHTRHSSTALSWRVSGTHPQLGRGDERFFSCAWSAQPLEGSAERETVTLVSLRRKQGRSSVEAR